MLQDTHFKASNTEPLIYRFGYAYIYANVTRMSWYTKCGQTFIQVQWLLKREIDSIELDIQTFIIKPVTVSKNVF